MSTALLCASVRMWARRSVVHMSTGRVHLLVFASLTRQSFARPVGLGRFDPDSAAPCLRAALAELPDRNAELPRLVGEVVLDAGAWEVEDADRQRLQHRVVALERGRLGVLRPVGPEGDLGHLSMAGPFGGDEFGALRRAAVQQHHVGVLGVNLIELGPDQPVIVEVEPPGHGHFRPGWQERLPGRALPGGEKVAAVDHRGGEVAMADLRSAARPPG